MLFTAEEGIVFALLTILIIVVVFRLGRNSGHGYDGCCSPNCGCPRCRPKEPFTDVPRAPPPPATCPSGKDLRPVGSYQNIRSLTADPPALEEAQRMAWSEAVSGGDSEYYNPAPGGGSYDEMVHHHTPGSSMNYQDALINLVADPRIRAQQADWYEEVAPKSQTAMTVDNLDEAAAVSTQNGHGLHSFRFPAPSQHNPLFITDQDAETYGEHATRFVL